MKYIRRIASFLASRLVIITICVSLLVCAFYMAFNIGNAYVLVTEGLEKRVEVCLTREDFVSLNSYFTVNFLNSDPVLAVAVTEESPYYHFNITDFDYEIKLQKLRGAWPWADYITCVVTEHVTDITGSVKSAYSSTEKGEITPWSSSRYTVVLRKQTDGSWKISSLKQDETYKDASVQ